MNTTNGIEELPVYIVDMIANIFSEYVYSHNPCPGKIKIKKFFIPWCHDTSILIRKYQDAKIFEDDIKPKLNTKEKCIEALSLVSNHEPLKVANALTFLAMYD